MYQTVRKIKPTRRSISGIYPFRQKESIAYESSLERDFIILQEADADVIRVVAQPVSLTFKLDNRTYPYTPDFLVLTNHSKYQGILVEVKPEAEWREHWRQWSTKWKVAMNWCKANNFQFRIYDESRIRTQKLSNIKQLNSLKHQVLDQSQIDSVLDNICQMGSVTVQEYLNTFSKEFWPQQKHIIWYLLAKGQVQANLEDNLDNELLIWSNSHD